MFKTSTTNRNRPIIFSDRFLGMVRLQRLGTSLVHFIITFNFINMKKILFILLSLLTVTAYSQTDSILQLQEVSVTSVRATLNQPITQTEIPAKLLRKTYQGQDVPVILNFSSPSIQFTSDGGNWSGYMYYRLRGAEQTRINATLNGVPLNEPEDQGAYFSNYQDFFSNVSSIQIQRGVGTSTTGSSSYIGSLNFQSPNLSDSQYTRVETGFGSFGTNRFSVVTNTGLKNGWGTYVRYSRIKSDGYRENSGTLGNTFFASTGYQDSKQSFKYTMFYGNSKNQMAWLPSTESDIKLNRRNNPLSKDERDDFTQTLNILSYSKYVTKNLSYNVSGFYNKLDGMYDVKFASDMFKYQLSSEFYGYLTNLNFQVGKLTTTVGINFSTYQRRHTLGLSPNYLTTILHDNLGQKDQFSSFTKLNYQLSKTISLFADLQYRSSEFLYFEDAKSSKRLQTTWKFWNPKYGINFRKGNHRAFAFYGRNSREPNRTDIFNFYKTNADPDHLPYDTAVKYGWSQVRPETVHDWELGYDFINNNHKISATAFYMFFENGLLPIGEINDIGLPINTSVPSSFRRGVEIDYNYRYKGLRFYLGTTLMDSRILSGNLSGNQMLLTPNCIVNSNISYSSKRWTLALLNKYVSRSYLSNSNSNDYLNEYIVTNLNLTYSSNHFSIGYNINNLFNQDYYNSGIVSFGTRQYFVAAPRNHFVNLTYSF